MSDHTSRRIGMKSARSFVVVTLVALLAAACGGGGGGGSSTSTLSLSGGGVKGPLAGAVVTAYAFDPTALGFKGAVIDTGETNSAAQIVGLELPEPTDPPYILEVTSDADTTDLTTGVYPVIQTMRTVITQEMLDSGISIYATPLTTMALGLAVRNADSNAAPYSGNSDGTVTELEFLNALDVAASVVTATLGFGLDSSVDIYTASPVINSDTDTAEEQETTAEYRTAVEAVTALVYELEQQSEGTTTDDVLASMTVDLDDGDFDDATTLEVIQQDPTRLVIPNTTLTVGQVTEILADETSSTGATTDTSSLSSLILDTAPAVADIDYDDDGIPNESDAYPFDPLRSVITDQDEDGWDVAYDPDDTDAAVPGTPFEASDPDGDGVPNDYDDDDDGDGIADSFEPFNGTDPLLADTDGDGSFDGVDEFPTDATEWRDTDADGTGDNADLDDDNDGLTDEQEVAQGTKPKVADTDGDTVADGVDGFPLDASRSLDTDLDGIDNIVDTDDDNDTYADDLDPCPLDATNTCVAEYDAGRWDISKWQ